MDYKRRGLAKQQGQVAVLVEIGPREPYKIIFRIMSAIAAYTYAYFKWKTNQKKKKTTLIITMRGHGKISVRISIERKSVKKKTPFRDVIIK